MRLINEDDVLEIIERVTNEAVEKKQPKYLIQPRIIAEISGLLTIEAEPVNGWISVKDRLPKTKMDHVLFTLYTPAWHDITDELPEDERDFPEEYVTVCGWFDVHDNGAKRYWSWISSDGYQSTIRNEYVKADTGMITYITHWRYLPEPPKGE